MYGHIAVNLAKSPSKKRSIYRREKHRFLMWKRMLAQNTDEFFKNTTLHGLKYVTNKELYSSERIFFGASVVVVILVCVFFITKMYTKWATTPVIFGINPEPTYITREPFPAVTICNLNQALKDKANAFRDSSVESAWLQILCKTHNSSTNFTVPNDGYNYEQLIIDLSQPCKDMIINCFFGHRSFNCSENFFPMITDEGLCCVFNMLHPKFMFKSHIPLTFRNISETDHVAVDWYAEMGYAKDLPPKFYPRTAVGIGESLGLSVTLNVEKDKYYCSSGNSIGFKISVHSPNDWPNVRETGVLIGPGMETKIRLRPEKVESEPKLRDIDKKDRHCVFHDESDLKYFSHYTARNCEMECMTEMTMKHCNCMGHFMPKIYGNATICGVNEAACVRTVILRTDPKIKVCLNDCLPSCYDMTFFSDVFMAQLSADGRELVKHRLERNFTREYVEKNIAIVTMYLKENTYRSMKRTEFVGVSDFLASVGGLLGLFIGFSLISIAEFFYFVVLRPCRRLLERRKAQNNWTSAAKVCGPSMSGSQVRSSLKPQHQQFNRYLKKRFSVEFAKSAGRQYAVNQMAAAKSISASLEFQPEDFAYTLPMAKQINGVKKFRN